MTQKELKKLNRSELLQMLLARTEEAEKLRKELEEAKEKLSNREIRIEQSGSIAEASLKLNEVFEAAQKAADQYLQNVRRVTGNEEPETQEPTEDPAEESADEPAQDSEEEENHGEE